MINYQACNEFTSFQPNCYALTPFQPNCFVRNAFNVCCRYSSVIQTSLLSWSWKQSLWTRIRLILREQSYLGPLQYLIPKNIFRQNERSKSVWLVGKVVNLCISNKSTERSWAEHFKLWENTCLRSVSARYGSIHSQYSYYLHVQNQRCTPDA